MVELFCLVVLVISIARLIEGRFERRQEKLDKAFRRHRYVTAAGIQR